MDPRMGSKCLSQPIDCSQLKYQRNEKSTGLVEMLDFFLVVVFVLKFINKARFPQNVSSTSRIST